MLAGVDWPLYLVAAFAVTIAPGPDNLLVLALGVAQGRRNALALATGLALGNIGHTLAVTLGVTILLATYPLLFIGLKLLGAAYLGWMAFKAWRTPLAPTSGEASHSRGAGRWFQRGLVMNLLNPKVALFFLAFLPPFIPAESPKPALVTMALGGVFIVQTLLIFGSIALLAGTLGAAWRTRPAAQRWSSRLTALILAFLALILLFAQLPANA